MCSFYSKLLLSLFSFLLFIFNVYIFYPVLTATNLIFPYSVHQFDIIVQYPELWHGIKLIYYINSFISIFLIVNSLIVFKKRNRKKKIHFKQSYPEPYENELNLFIGYNSLDQKKVYISGKSLFQNVLITGTIGSRQN